MIKQEGLYQNKVTVSLASIHNCKMAYLRRHFVCLNLIELRPSKICARVSHDWDGLIFAKNSTFNLAISMELIILLEEVSSYGLLPRL